MLFCDGVQQGMSIAVTPAGRVYLVCRNEIVVLEDKDHDLKPDGPPKTLVKLDTKATYPHNGLNGAALSPDGQSLYFCLGLNTGFDYTVVGADGTKVSGGGEGGSVWRCTPDGGKVERVAIGFWNCHDLTFDALGRLFAVDNDPDDIGPCRLLDIVDGGDYGWKFKNGRKGVHPFTSWAGELPGTLPMVAPTGEAPSGVLAYEGDNLPADYRGQLLVTSWGDHVVQRFTLKEKGASFTSVPQEMIRGGEDFRPVGIAEAPDGSVFISDWVDKSYTLHGKGKLWRVRAKDAPQREPRGSAPGPSGAAVTKPAVAPADPADQLQQDIAAYAARNILLSLPPDSDFPLPTSIPGKYRDDPFMTSAAATALSRSKQLDEVLKFGPNSDTEWVVVVDLLAARRSGRPEAAGLLPRFLRSHSETVRRLALQWAGEDRLTRFAADVDAALKAGPVTRDLLSAYLACKEKLASEPPAPGKPPAERSAKQFAADFLFDDRNDLAARKIALELIDPADPKVPANKLIALVEPMGLEAVKALAWRDDEKAQAALRAIAADEKAGVEVRKEAIAGLARTAGTSDKTWTVLTALRRDDAGGLASDARRSSRGRLPAAEILAFIARYGPAAPGGATKPAAPSDLGEQLLFDARQNPGILTIADAKFLNSLVAHRPTDTAGWQKAAAEGGDVENGRRLFSLATGGRCYVCHQINGRGGQVGPDLSRIGGAMDRAKIVESIVEPSKEVAPLFVATTVDLKDGTSITGVGLPEPGASFVSVADATGKRHRIKADDIEARRTQKLSVMPDGLAETMTVVEFRDLVAYLASLK